MNAWVMWPVRKLSGLTYCTKTLQSLIGDFLQMSLNRMMKLKAYQKLDLVSLTHSLNTCTFPNRINLLKTFAKTMGKRFTNILHHKLVVGCPRYLFCWL